MNRFTLQQKIEILRELKFNDSNIQRIYTQNQSHEPLKSKELSFIDDTFNLEYKRYKHQRRRKSQKVEQIFKPYSKIIFRP